MNHPFISVILPVYNGEKFLKEAIKSILNQLYSNYELIIINDGSTDNSRSIIEEFSDTRIVAIHKFNEGLVPSLNMGIKESKGLWIARMDSDDISDPARFSEQIKYISPEIAVIGTQAKIIDASNKFLTQTQNPLTHTEIVNKIIKRKSCIIHPTVLIQKKLLNEVGGYNNLIKHAEDYDLWLRLIKIGKFINLNKHLLSLRKHSNNISKIKLEEATTNALISLAFYSGKACYNPITADVYSQIKTIVSEKLKETKYYELLLKHEEIKKGLPNMDKWERINFILKNKKLLLNYISLIYQEKQLMSKIFSINKKI